MFNHECFSEELHCVQRWAPVQQKGPCGEIFDKDPVSRDSEYIEQQGGVKMNNKSYRKKSSILEMKMLLISGILD